MKQQLNEVKRMQQLANIIVEEITPKNKDASKLQFILRDLCDFYGEETADDLISDEWKNYTVGQIIQDWINLKKQVTEAPINVVDSIPELQRKLKDLAINLPKIKGIDVAEVKNLNALIDAITSKLGKGSIGIHQKAALDVFNRRTQGLN